MLPKGKYTLGELDEWKASLEKDIIEKRKLVKDIEQERQSILLAQRINKAVDDMSDEEKSIMSQAIGVPSEIGGIRNG